MWQCGAGGLPVSLWSATMTRTFGLAIKQYCLRPSAQGGFTTPTIYDVIISVVNSGPSVKNIISMSFARRHSFRLNGHNPQTTSTPTIPASSTISISMPATHQATCCALRFVEPTPPELHRQNFRRSMGQQSGSGLCAEGFDVSCSTSLPRSPDRIAESKKPKA